MDHTCTQLREVVRSIHQLKVDGLSINDDTDCFKSRCNVERHDWEIRFHPVLYVHGKRYCPGLDLVFLGESRTSVTAVLSNKVIDHRSHDDFVPFKEKKTVPKAFHRPLDRSPPLYIGVGKARYDFYSFSCTVEVTISLLTQPPAAEGAIPVPCSDLPQHLGELLRSQAGADVTFSVSGESFAAHKSVLATRSPVFIAELFGEMKEKNSQLVEIQDIDTAVLKAILYFIYTDAVPELDVQPEAAATALAQHLLIAANRYGLDRLKVTCERRLALGMDVGTVASTLALAEQQNCSRLKAKCIEFIAGGSQENLAAVLATEGYRHLVVSSPSVLTELLKAAHAKKSTCSCKPLHGGLQDQFTSTQAATLRTMKHTCPQLTEGVQSVHLLKINGFSVTMATIGNDTNCIKSRCSIDGYDWEIRFYHAQCQHPHRHPQDAYLVAIVLVFRSEPCTHGVEANISGRLVEYKSCGVVPMEWKPASKIFKHPSDCTFPIYIGKGTARDSQLVQSPASLTVECTFTVFRDIKAICLPTSNLHRHLDKLLQSQAAADVTLTVSGETFAAHKNILAARSPVFKAEFFGEMKEKTSQCVESKDVDAQVFKAMLHFIYTDMVPDDFDNQPTTDTGLVMAQHLLVAADMYGLDRLKVMSEHRLSLGIGIDTVASTLALAEQFNCSQPKAKCIEFINGGSIDNLDAVLATEGYRHLEASSPSVH